MKKKQSLQQAQIPLKDTPFTSRSYGQKVIQVELSHPNAKLPIKHHDTDIGYDVNLVERCDGITEDTVGQVTLFNTGLRIKPPEGYYVEIVARSSLYKTGYQLVNSVGIIDPDYRGTIMVPLLKFRAGDDLALPDDYIQMIVRKAEYAYVGEADEQLGETERGKGGFGSTNKLKPKKGKEKEVGIRRNPRAERHDERGVYYN
jgi:dUTP pyrophosphatase